METIVRDLANCFSNSVEFHLGLLIPNTRKPAIKLTHNPMKIHLDLSFNDGLGARHTDILDHWMNLQGREARKLALFIRKWFSLWRLGKYFHKMLEMLVVYFLQWEGFLPSYWKVRAFGTPIFVRSIDCAFNRYFTDAVDYDVRRMDDYKDHIKDFFDFYRDFDFQHRVVCPFVGGNYMVERDELLSDDEMLRE
jgi:DNA polymerase sigma